VQETLLLYKSFYALCCTPNSHTTKEDTQILLAHVMDIQYVSTTLVYICHDSVSIFKKRNRYDYKDGKLKSLNLIIIIFLLYTVLQTLNSTQSTHRVAFHQNGKISTGWRGWGVLAHPFRLYLPSRTKLQCTLQWEGRYTPPISSLVLYELCAVNLVLCTVQCEK
jgi:hypothetical protein